MDQRRAGDPTFSGVRIAGPEGVPTTVSDRDVAPPLRAEILAAVGLDTLSVVAVEIEPSVARLGTRGAPDPTHETIPVEVFVPDAPPGRALTLLVEEGGAYRWLIPEPSRGTRSRRSRDGETRFTLECRVAPLQERGLVGTVVKHVIQVLVFDVVERVAGKATERVVRRWEADHRPPRLRWFRPENYQVADVPALEVEDLRTLAGQRSLLLLHGLNDRTHTGFGALPEVVVRGLSARYGGRVIAFDHPTLSVDPGENCRQLLALLPPDVVVELDVLAHSRGGLVARVLAERPPELDVDVSRVRVRQVVFVATPNRGTPLADPVHLGHLVDGLTNLLDVIPDNPASPLIDALSGIVAVVKQLAVGALGGLDGLVAMRPPESDPEGFLARLNRRRDVTARYRAVSADYTPPPGSGLGRLARDAFTDRLFRWEANDLIVPTRSVYGWNGAGAFPIAERLVLPAERGIDHNSFWTATDVTDLFESWLVGADADLVSTAPTVDGARAGRVRVVACGNEPDPLADVDERLAAGDVDGLREAIRALPDRHLQQLESEVGKVAVDQFTRGIRGPKAGRVLVLPGIMGSRLAAQDSPSDVDLIWINPLRLLNGDFDRLRHRAATEPITAVGLHRTYLPLVIGLDEQWDVTPFAYDWRLGLDRAADALADRIGELGGRAHLVAHSMGGLVCRLMRRRRRAVWDGLADGDLTAGGRLVMLGTPNLGSLSIATALTGEDKLVRWLARLDVRNRLDDVRQIIATFPGVYQLLPFHDPDGPLYRPASWQAAKVSEALLTDARGVGAELVADGLDAERMLYVAGAGHRTAFDVQIDAPGRFRFRLTTDGDGRVTHASGLASRSDGRPALDAWYSTADHGGLVKDRIVIDAISDLLRTGSTSRLEREPPLDRSTEVSGELVSGRELEPPPLIPSLDVATTRGEDGHERMRLARDLATEATRSWLGSPPVAPPPSPALSVKVLHASLEHASHAVVVGHYAGTPLGGAEARADVLLRGRLSARQVFGRYPSQPTDVLRAAPTGPEEGAGFAGVIVVGLGEMGDLTPTTLTHATRNAALEWALGSAPPNDGPPAPVVVGMSSVLIGSYGPDALQLGTVIGALVEGVLLANRELAQVETGRSVLIDELELVELYGQRAEEAARIVADIERFVPSAARSGGTLRGAPRLATGEGGRPSTPSADYAMGMWRRLIVTVPGGSSVDRERAWAGRVPLTFTSLGVRARADLLAHVIDNRLVGQMVRDAVGSVRVDGATNIALFELLLPNDVKRELATIENLVLVVDEHTATIPWEAIADRSSVGGVEPLVKRMGLVRQLQLAERRPISGPAHRLRALVIGDPPVGDDMPRLPGAREEADAVAKQLDAAGLNVDRLVFGPEARFEPRSASALVGKLLSEDYQVVHIAAHGWFEPKTGDEEAWGGVVIGPGQYISAVEISQMRRPPDLVFLNCCHLAAVDSEIVSGVGAEALALQRQRRPQLAASLSRALMAMGVRAVVAAGWAVNDRAAATFASELYARMLDGEAFGPAVRLARLAVHSDDGGLSNTWAAYQCYGDPGFRIATKPRRQVCAALAVSADELSRVVGGLKIRAGDAGADLDEIREELRRLEEQALASWADRGDVRAELGRAFGECGDFRDAVRLYRSALDARDGDVSIWVIEQLANLEMRLAASLADGGTVTLDGDRAETAAELLDSARARAVLLGTLPATAERCSIVAGIWKAVAVAADGSERRDALKAAARAYFCAWARDGEPYGANNALQLDGRGGLLQPQKQRARLLEAIDDPEFVRSGKDVWARLAPADLALTRALVGSGITNRKVLDTLHDLYASAFGTRSTSRERSSVTRHLSELSKLQRDADAAKALAHLAERLAMPTRAG